MVYGEQSEEMMEILSKNVEGEIIRLINIDVMDEKLRNVWALISSVKEMGVYKTLITFATEENMEDALAHGDNFSKNYLVRR